MEHSRKWKAPRHANESAQEKENQLEVKKRSQRRKRQSETLEEKAARKNANNERTKLTFQEQSPIEKRQRRENDVVGHARGRSH